MGMMMKERNPFFSATACPSTSIEAFHQSTSTRSPQHEKLFHTVRASWRKSRRILANKGKEQDKKPNAVDYNRECSSDKNDLLQQLQASFRRKLQAEVDCLAGSGAIDFRKNVSESWDKLFQISAKILRVDVVERPLGRWRTPPQRSDDKNRLFAYSFKLLKKVKNKSTNGIKSTSDSGGKEYYRIMPIVTLWDADDPPDGAVPNPPPMTPLDHAGQPVPHNDFNAHYDSHEYCSMIGGARSINLNTAPQEPPPQLSLQPSTSTTTSTSTNYWGTEQILGPRHFQFAYDVFISEVFSVSFWALWIFLLCSIIALDFTYCVITHYAKITLRGLFWNQIYLREDMRERRLRWRRGAVPGGRWSCSRRAMSIMRDSAALQILRGVIIFKLCLIFPGHCGTNAASLEPTIYLRSNASLAVTRNEPCPVIWLSNKEPLTDPHTNEPLQLGMFRATFTDATDLVPFGKASHPLYHLDHRVFPRFPRHLTEAKMGVRKVSFLFPPLETMDQLMFSLFEEARENFPNDVFIDLTTETRLPAFQNYTFSILFGQDNQDLPSPRLLEAIAHGVVPTFLWWQDETTGEPIFKHFLDYCYYFKYAVAKFRFPSFTPQSAHKFLTESAHSDAIYVMQSSLKLVQDFFYYRYRLPFEENLLQQARMVCREQEQAQLTPFAFIGVLSGKANFNRRQAMRDTWLKVLENDLPRGPGPNKARPQRDESPMRVTYKFFVNRVGSEQSDEEDPDWLLRGEAELFRDVVFVDAPPEYPIGNQGMQMWHWVANHTDAGYILKIDDDIYLRPVQFFQHLNQLQRAQLYLGAFDYSGEVIRDPDSAHFLADEKFVSDVFPPYARGAGVVITLDLVRKFVEEDRKKRLTRLRVEDASYGLYLHQLVRRDLASVTLYDMMEEHFAMDAKCCTEITHPNNCWAPLNDRSYVVHHMKPEQLVCMFRKDTEAGLYVQLTTTTSAGAAQQREGATAASPLGPLFPNAPPTVGVAPVAAPPKRRKTVKQQQMDMWLKNFGGEQKKLEQETFTSVEYDVGNPEVMASLCDCVYTPPPHPDEPLQGNHVNRDHADTAAPKLQYRPSFEW
ncbi:unnamed protein product [Amoebophrya sp. A120]|nr:unnamed protein product [Amoebophrya sp. A120]|eukprot:GSA120T00020089001.1